LNSTAEKLSPVTNHEELAHLQAAGSVMLLKQMHDSPDVEMRRAIFEQVCDQETSHISEVLPGVVNTRFNFDIRDRKLFVLQPHGVTDWRKMHEMGVARAQSMAEISSNLKFYEDIAKAELQEAITQEELITKGKPAAMVTLSLCGEDVGSSHALKKLGRDPDQRRAFLRVYWTDGVNKQINLDSRSVDNMALVDGIAMIKGLGKELPDGANSLDVLSSRVIIEDLSESEMSSLADKLVDSFDRKLLKRTGNKHKAGRSEVDAQDTYNFVLEQEDLINVHMESLCELASRDLPLSILAEYSDDLRYDIMASFKRRMKGEWEECGSLADSVSNAGGAERSIGTEFRGCETIIGAKSSNNLTETGMANAQNPENWRWEKGKCQIPECPNRKENKTVDVGPCDVCAGCQSLFDNEMTFKEVNNYYRQKAQEQESEKAAGFFDIIAADLTRYKQDIEQKELARKKKETLQKKQAMASDVENTTLV
jgi:hypothetical protein